MQRPRNITEEEFTVLLSNLNKVGGCVGRHATDKKHVPGPKATSVPNRRGSDRPSKNRDAGINPAPPPQMREYRSKLEAAFAGKLDLDKKAGFIREWCYEPMSFKLSVGKRYRPDFLVWYPLGMERMLEFVEVKPKWGKNRRDGVTHLKWAAQKYPMFQWTLTWRENGGWVSENVEV